MPTVEVLIHAQDDLHEFLIAELADMDFDAFERGDDQLWAYIPSARWDDFKREQVERWLHRRGVTDPIVERTEPERNWNEEWERTVQPIRVGPFLVRPSWTSTPPEHDDALVLEIDPKMSFGTGYHASTRLALRLLPDIISEGDKVLDAGAGTGILAIAAIRLGAASSIAFDISDWAQQNALENTYINQVTDRIDLREGSLEVVPETGFDAILANISRSVLLDMLPGFTEKLVPGGHLILSGLLRTDRDRMVEAATAQGLALAREATEGKWWAATFVFSPAPEA